VQTGLDVIATNADAVSTAADAIATAADAVQTGLDVVATAADAVQTGLDAAAAAASESAALGSANSAAASFDLFDDRFLGAKASDPTLDNDGNALVEGALYFNSTTDTSKVYNGTAWQNVAPVATTIDLATQVTGTLAAANGGTGLTTLGTAAQILAVNSGATALEYVALPAGSAVVRVARTSNTILDGTNRGNLIDITSGTFSQTFTAAATLGSGWFVYLRNSGTGDITLEPDGAELIDGLTNFIMYGGETRLVQCTGTAFTSVVLSPFYRAFTASGTFTTPPGYSVFGAMLWSGGASGAKSSGGTAKGGAGGGCFKFDLLASTFGATETISVGAGGASVTSADTGGDTGGDTTIGSLAIVLGGTSSAGGGVGISTERGRYRISIASATLNSSNNAINAGFGSSVGGTATVHTIWGGASSINAATQNGGSSIYGGASGGSHDDTTARLGGTSIYGGNGGAASVTTNGTDGSAPGGGGGACKNTGNSGAGGRGEVRIWGVV